MRDATLAEAAHVRRSTGEGGRDPAQPGVTERKSDGCLCVHPFLMQFREAEARADPEYDARGVRTRTVCERVYVCVCVHVHLPVCMYVCVCVLERER